MTFNREPEAGHVRENRRMTGCDTPNLRCFDFASSGSNARDCTALDVKTSDFAILNDIDAERVRTPGIAPCDRVMSRNPRFSLQAGAEHRISDIGRNINNWAELSHLTWRQELQFDALQSVRVVAPCDFLEVAFGMRHMHDAARTKHDIIVQFLAKAGPEAQRMSVDTRTFVLEIVRADDCCVASDVAAAQPAFFEHGDPRHAVFLSHIVSGCEAVAAGANDYGVVFRFRIRASPLPRSRTTSISFRYEDITGDGGAGA